MNQPQEAVRPRAGQEPGPVDPEQWPDVARVPDAPLRARLSEALLNRVARRLGLGVELPDGPAVAGSPVLRLNQPQAFHRRVGAGGLIGFGEAYQAGDWDADDLAGVLTVLARSPQTLVPPGLQWLRRFYVAAQPKAERNTPDGARRNIQRHYDLSNELFALFLDRSMTYSSALFEEDGTAAPVASWEVLEAAQHRKIDQLLDLAGVGPGTRLLEIGSGWGELALRAARRGATVLTLTLSQEQRQLARAKLEQAGVADRVEVRLQDYRAVEGEFDAVVSVEMIEAVGERYWPAYFSTIDRVLAPGGRVAIQAITMAHDRMEATKDTYTWIHKYIFPGGIIPSVEAVERVTAEHTRLRLLDRRRFGPHYAETLRLWRERFDARRAEVAALGFDGVFRRMWELYLAYSEAGFRTGYLDVQQLLLARA
ncbi:SAM-dependent methyltransferase [Streptacidiphilus griseoplanus]|uniref:SAM-dependent methyltransferase n=1 Tax=Peterkaempfera griseoplana TaxID=66896 RepID=UPI0006E3260C|nr:cyclopropane-fatty-acyl-phospholipid synthase family protein [Peterkaempfera griseoplana]